MSEKGRKARVAEKENEAWKGRQGSDFDGHKRHVWIPAQGQWKLLKDLKLWRGCQNGARTWATLCHGKNRGRKTREAAITITQAGNDGDVAQAPGNDNGE